MTRGLQAWAKLHLSYDATAGGWTEDTHQYLCVEILSLHDEGREMMRIYCHKVVSTSCISCISDAEL